MNFRQEWLQWWKSRGLASKTLPILLLALYWTTLLYLNGLHGDLIVMSLIPTILYYLGPKFHSVLSFLLPLFLTSIIYDSQRYYSDFLRGPIHVEQPYHFDKRFFGIATPEGVLTPNEWWQLHTSPILDFFCGVSYIIFIPFFVLTSAYFCFWASRKGTRKVSASEIRYRAPQMMWAFLWVNLIGYSTYYWYAAAPPWYVALYGLGPAQLGVPANLAGCARFDALVGLPIFKNWYGRSADVFGAIPSLHVSYPFIGAYFAWRFGALRLVTTAFYLLICFSAIYLDHHYVLDVLLGSGYALAVAMTCDWFWGREPKITDGN